MTSAAARVRAQLFLATAIAATCGCARATEVSGALERVQRSVEQVLSAGAYVCAPRELALARAHLEFARAELDRGEPSRAEEHLDEAALNAAAAERLSPPERCRGAAGMAPAPAPAPVAQTEGADRDGDGVPDANDACPDQPEDHDGFEDTDGCPDLDNDNDRVPDALDRCPTQAEDYDGFEDSDGCPDPDNDQDGVPDAMDRCPTQAGPPVDQGCPRTRYKGLEITKTALRLLEPVVFGEGTADIRSVSYGLLDTVALALAEHPTIAIEVQGHTDSRGDDNANMKLSQARAEAVVAYLAAHGVDRSRLTAVGYGETRPIESNRTSQGRDINRRVELVRTDRAQ